MWICFRTGVRLPPIPPTGKPGIIKSSTIRLGFYLCTILLENAVFVSYAKRAIRSESCVYFLNWRGVSRTPGLGASHRLPPIPPNTKTAKTRIVARNSLTTQVLAFYFVRNFGQANRILFKKTAFRAKMQHDNKNRILRTGDSQREKGGYACK